ncbi:SDR family oxidoreductase [Mycolicibacterium sp. P9-64]|uniref:SDR family oxidoreductase n=1 Tax=Mycolicibacterium sp. P9-64 TaxID=2024612 RepID=UPI0011F0691F|nr:SDR family oxidoreductase [Mycolicibacterium sp. P9-64]KAA0085620.1 SDR family oxidoreductase [Mycolicibacterium sp. P9-64]
MPRLAGKHALITGGTSGIGLETACRFLAEGATVAITGRSQERLDAVREDLHGSVLTICSDAGDVAGQEHVAAVLKDTWPKLDILVANAADVTHRPIEEWDEKAFDTMMATNLKGPFFLVRALLPLFSQQTSVILVGSVSAFIGHTHAAVYGASKAGLFALARQLSYELKDRGIRVNGLSPGPTSTNALKVHGPAREAELQQTYGRMVPIQRMGQAAEIASAAVYLASDEAAFTVATVLRVDGGLGELIDEPAAVS